MKYRFFGISLFLLCVMAVHAQQLGNLNSRYESLFLPSTSVPYKYLDLNTEQIASLYSGASYAESEHMFLVKNKVQRVTKKHNDYTNRIEGAYYNEKGQILQSWSSKTDTTTWSYNQNNQLINKTVQGANASVIDFEHKDGYLYIKEEFYWIYPKTTNCIYFNKDNIFYVDTGRNDCFTSTSKAIIKTEANSKRIIMSRNTGEEEALHFSYNRDGQIDAIFNTNNSHVQPILSKYYYNRKRQLRKKEIFSSSWIDNAQIRFFYRKNQQLRKEIVTNIQTFSLDGRETEDTITLISTAWYNKKGSCKRKKVAWLLKDKTVFSTTKTKYHYNKKDLLTKKLTKRFIKRRKKQESTVTYDYGFFL